MKDLVFVHGRSQQNLNPLDLKAQWFSALNEGMKKINRQLPIDEAHVHLPYYGNTLMDLCRGMTPEQAAQVIQQGNASDEQERKFAMSMIGEMAQVALPPPELAAAPSGNVIEQGVKEWSTVQWLLRRMDGVPGVNAEAISLATHDVYQYLRQTGISIKIDREVIKAFKSGVETVLVSHSLGTVVAYNVLRKLEVGARVNQFVTLGSPLAISAIKTALAPLSWPEPVVRWMNARDPRDVVALFPLVPPRFSVSGTDGRTIVDNSDVSNAKDDPHSIDDYLNDPSVAECIYKALV
jgi:hypothetical protein